MDYNKRNGKYRIKISSADLKKHKEFIKDLIRESKGIAKDTTSEE